MSATVTLVFKYTVFCIISMILNLGTQYLFDLVIAPELWVSMGAGTSVGLFAKYILDRNYIFSARRVTATKDAKRFVLYTLMGVVTTSLFWATEWAFLLFSGQVWAKYLGGAIGLTLGYIFKYKLDSRFVFKNLQIYEPKI